MNFDEWIYRVCEHIASERKKDITDIYSLIDLTDAKLSYIDGVQPEDYKSTL